MSGSDHRERREAIKFAEKHGWRLREAPGKGYDKLLCACGEHQRWVHKTPSNPNYWRELRAYIERTCSVT